MHQQITVLPDVSLKLVFIPTEIVKFAEWFLGDKNLYMSKVAHAHSRFGHRIYIPLYSCNRFRNNSFLECWGFFPLYNVQNNFDSLKASKKKVKKILTLGFGN